jgi:purine-nucleoside/S-methyl-5'-thioadenosine phosphorylase / adenosine deaminase
MWSLAPDGLPPLWRLEPEPQGARLAFSTRVGGVSHPPYDTLNLGRTSADRPEAVGENRRRVLAALDVAPERLATAGQVHGERVALVETPGLERGCDALVTRVPDLALAVSSADCLPLLYETSGAVAVAHAGWRGALAGIAEATLAALCETAGVTADRVRVHLGPCIRSCCYQVGPEVAEQFPSTAVERRDGALYVNLPATVRLRLAAAGLPAARVLDTGACTACEARWYFSHRRDRGLTGRSWGVAVLRDGVT